MNATQPMTEKWADWCEQALDKNPQPATGFSKNRAVTGVTPQFLRWLAAHDQALREQWAVCCYDAAGNLIDTVAFADKLSARLNNSSSAMSAILGRPVHHCRLTWRTIIERRLA